MFLLLTPQNISKMYPLIVNKVHPGEKLDRDV